MKLSFRTKFFYAGGDFAINTMWQLTVFYLLFFYTDIFGISPSKAGLVFFIAKIWDVFTDPLMGYIADHTSTRWGKFRPYILFASIPALAAIVLCFTAPNLSDTGKFYWALSTYVTFTTLYTIIAIPYGALIPAMTQDTDERTTLASFRYLGASSGALAIATLTLPIVGIFASRTNSFAIAVAILASVAAVFLFLCFLNTNENYSKVYEKRISFKKIFKMLTSNYPLHLIIIAMFGTWTAHNMKQITSIYFVKYNLLLEQYWGLILFGVILQIMAGAYSANLMKDKFEKKNLFLFGAFLYVSTDLIVYYITGYQNFWLLAFVASFGYFGYGMAGVMTWSLLFDTIEYGEWKSGFRSEGIIASFYASIYKLTVGVSAWMAGIILETNNYQPNEIIQNAETLKGLFQMSFLFPAIGGIIAILFLYNYKYDRVFFKKIVQEIGAKKI